MAELRETHTIFGPFVDWDPLDTALLFFRTNRYHVLETQTGPIPEGLERTERPAPAPEHDEATVDGEEADDLEASVPSQGKAAPESVTVRLELERGEPGRGWTSSNLAELPTRIELVLDGNKVQVRYTVTTTGQHLRGDEREFWKREARALENYLLAEGAIPNLFAEETLRASEVRREFVVMGLWIGSIVAVVIFVTVIMFFRL